MSKGSAILFIVWLVGFELLFGSMLKDSAWLLQWQYRAQSFPSVSGVIVEARVEASYSSRHTTYYPRLFYSYSVDGQVRTHCDQNGASPMPSVARTIVADHPVSSAVPVYYDPANPDNSLLIRELFPGTVFAPFLIAAVVFGLLALVPTSIDQIREAWGEVRVAGGFPILASGSIVRVRLPRCRAFTGTACTAAASFLLAGGFFFCQFDIDASSLVPEIQISLILIGASTIAAYAWLAGRIASGACDLVIDETARTVRLPLTFGRSAEKAFPFSDVEQVAVPATRNVTRGGTVYYTYVPTLHIKGREPEPLTNDLNEDRAHSFAVWLRDHLGLPQLEA